MRSRFLTILAVAVSGCIGVSESSRHGAAMQKFEELRMSGFKASHKEIQATLDNCFPEGREVAKVAKVLSTAKREERGHGEFTYTWQAEGDDQGYFIQVIIYNEAIKSAWNHRMPST